MGFSPLTTFPHIIRARAALTGVGGRERVSLGHIKAG